MTGLEGRTSLLSQLGGALEARPDIAQNGRPGDILGMSYLQFMIYYVQSMLTLRLLCS
jgi:hypothetical protein